MALASRLEEERANEFIILIENILKTGGNYEIKKKPQVNINVNKKKKPDELPNINEVLPSILGNGVIME